MDPHRDFKFALELQLKDLGFLEEYQDPGDRRPVSAGSSSDRAYAIRCMKEDLLDLQRSAGDPPLEPSGQDRSRLSPSPTPEPLDKKCVSCLEQYETLTFTAPCNHGFCHTCTHRLILGATSEESQFPPRCCDNDVPRAVIRSVLNAEELKEYNAKALEYSTKTRLYCAEPTCAAFIPPSNIKDEHGSCLKCGRMTHVICRSFAHPGIDCPQDTELHALLKVAEKKKWKRCSVCRRMVELMVGCNHITCICGHHFCYVCGLAWRTCRCAIWYEHRLILGADQEVNDQDAAPADDPLQVHLRVGRDIRAELQRVIDGVVFDRTMVEGQEEEEDGEGEEEDEEESEEEFIGENEGDELEADELSEQGDDEPDVIFMGSNPVHNHIQEYPRLGILGDGGTVPQSCGRL